MINYFIPFTDEFCRNGTGTVGVCGAASCIAIMQKLEAIDFPSKRIDIAGGFCGPLLVYRLDLSQFPIWEGEVTGS
jgi:hypothetical protein